MADSNITPRRTRIYALVDPHTGRPRYVGQSLQKALSSRLHQHVHEKASNPKSQWIQSLLQGGARPTIVELETVDSGDAVQAEKSWIDRLQARGENLLNTYDPDLSAPRPESSAKKISDFRKSFVGWRHKEETKKKIGRVGESNAGSKLTAPLVREIRDMCANGISQREAARRYGVSAQTVCDVVRRTLWVHVE